MTSNKTEILKEALNHFGASDFNEDLLKEINLHNLLEWSILEKEPRLCFRSSWALEHILLKNNKHIDNIYEELVENYSQVKNWSSLRSYSKLMMWLLSKKNETIILSEYELEKILEKSFKIIEDITCPVAVKVNAYDILFGLIPYYDWLANELKLLIELDLEKENTPALRSRGIKILNKLDKLK